MVRHGITASGTKGLFLGHSDEGLNRQGRDQALQAAGWIAREMPESVAWPVVASPLERARETARLIASAAGGTVAETATAPELAEMSFGAWEGMTTLEVKAAFPEQRRARKRDRWNFAPPGGESFKDICERLEHWLSRLDRPVIAVTHSGIIRVAAYLLGNLDQTQAMALSAGHCSVWKRDENGFRHVWGLPTGS